MSSPVRRILEPCSSPEPAQPSWMDLPGSTTQQQMIEALETARREAGELTTQMIDEHESSQDLGDAKTPPRKVRKKDADTPEVATPPSLKRYSLERQRQWYRKKLGSLEKNLGQDGAAPSKEATASSSISSVPEPTTTGKPTTCTFEALPTEAKEHYRACWAHADGRYGNRQRVHRDLPDNIAEELKAKLKTWSKEQFVKALEQDPSLLHSFFLDLFPPLDLCFFLSRVLSLPTGGHRRGAHAKHGLDDEARSAIYNQGDRRLWDVRKRSAWTFSTGDTRLSCADVYACWQSQRWGVLTKDDILTYHVVCLRMCKSTPPTAARLGTCSASLQC